LLGGFAAGVGWVVGVALLWASETWTAREKLFGTLVVPGGLAFSLSVIAFALSAVGGQTCSGGSDSATRCSGGLSPGAEAATLIGLILLFVAPLATTLFLTRRMNRHTVAASA
jgi:hypothetical protein